MTEHKKTDWSQPKAMTWGELLRFMYGSTIAAVFITVVAVIVMTPLMHIIKNGAIWATLTTLLTLGLIALSYKRVEKFAKKNRTKGDVENV